MTRDQRERIRRERMRSLERLERDIDRDHSDEEQRRAAMALGILHHLPAPQADLELIDPA